MCLSQHYSSLTMFVRSVVVIFAITHLSTAADPCQTPSGQNGDCKPISACPTLYALFNTNLDQKNAAYLRTHHCGFAGKVPKVCCVNSLLPDPATCGYAIESKIIGGTKTKPDEHPWMALLQYELRNGSKVFNCGGALISSRYILTAAHCIKSSLISVRLGEHDLATEKDCIKNSLGEDCAPAPLNIPVEKAESHESYDRDNFNKYNDIALVRLTQDIPFSDYVRPICLPSLSEELSKTYVDENLYIAGWGITENGTTSSVKLKVKVPVKERSFCEGGYKRYGFNLNLKDTQLCAGGEKGRDSCGGDSGGPLMTVRLDSNKDNQWYAAGLVSFGPQPCGMSGWGGVYTRVSKFLPWINSHLKP